MIKTVTIKSQKLPLRPYPGEIHLVRTRKAYHKAFKQIFGEPDSGFNECVGRTAFSNGAKNFPIFLVYAPKNHLEILAHEFGHVILETFLRVGIDPREAAGEPFCYMLSQLMLEGTSYD